MKELLDALEEIKERLTRLEVLLRGNGGRGLSGMVWNHEERVRGLERALAKAMVLLGIWQGILTALISGVLAKLVLGR